MDKKTLTKKIELYLNSNSKSNGPYIDYEKSISEFLDAVVLFNLNSSEEIFLKTIKILKNTILEEEIDSNYTVGKNAIFGDFKDIRNAGFYKRYLHNIKLTSTYIKAYQLTEDEYVETFGKKRYSTYDSFRIIKNRIIKKE